MQRRTNPLNTYVTQVEDNLRDEDSYLRAIREHRGVNGVQFATDYSEIYAYCFVATNRALTFTDKDDPGKQIASNEALSTRLFFGKEPALLLTAYQAELSTLDRSIREYSTSSIYNIAQSLRDEGSSSVGLAQWLEEISDKLENSQGQSFLRVLTEIYERAPQILIFLSTDFDPAARLAHFKKNANVVRVTQMVGAQRVTPNPETTDWWLTRLQEKRTSSPFSSSIIDAAAIAQLQSLNMQSALKRPVLLVTRSDTMRRILAEHSSEPACEGVYMINPRLLGTYFVGERTGLPASEVLADRYWLGKEIIEEFTRNSYNPDGSVKYVLKTLVRQIRKLWAELDDVVVARSVWGQETADAPIGRARNHAVESIRDLLKSQEKVRDVLARRAAEVANSLLVNSANIAAVGAVRPDGGLHASLDVTPRDALRASADVPSLVIRASADAMPHSMQVYDVHFSEWLGRDSDIINTLKKFIKSNSQSSEYERLLGMGYLLATNGFWEISLAYFNIAANMDVNSPPKHESYYLRAIARRNVLKQAQISDLEECAQDLLRANKIKRERRGDGYWDPRYLNQLGIILDMLLRRGRSPGWGNPWQDDPRKIWRQALAATIDDIILRAQIQNNLTYHLTLEIDHYGIPELSAELRQLAILVDGSENIARTAGIEHTFVIGNYLVSNKTPRDAAGALQSLQEIKARRSGWPALNRIIDDDISKFRELSRG